MTVGSGILAPRPLGLVAELVDAVDSKSTGLAHLGSTPSEATMPHQHILYPAGVQSVSREGLCGAVISNSRCRMS